VDRKPIAPLIYRSIHFAVGNVWHDVFFAAAALLLGTLFSWAVFDLPWEKVVLANLIALVAIPLLLFVIHFPWVFARPDRNRSWERKDSNFVSYREGEAAPGILYLSVKARPAREIGRNRCEVTDPDGAVWAEPHSASPEFSRGLQCAYPNDFPGAPPIKSGTYKVRWSLGLGKTRWREILRYEEAVKI
jgi:hypothetical protein